MSERSSGQLITSVRHRLARTRQELETSLWFLPTVVTAGLALLAIGVVAIDRALWQNGTDGLGPGWFRGGVDGARGVLTAIAGSLIAAAATVFSITVVVLQLASNQFTPRVVRNFTSDRNFQITLGLLLGTFVYSLLALWSVGREHEDSEPFIPTLAVGIGIVLALISVAVLILFIHRVSDLIQVSLLVDRLADDTNAQIKHQYGDEDTDTGAVLPEIDLSSSVSVRSPGAGYVRSIDHEALLSKADERSCMISVSCHIGDFVLIDSELAQVRATGDDLDEDFVRDIQRAFERGPYRLFESDIELAVQRITDIAVKALSPGVNDPTTAINCIERLCEVLQQIAIRDAPSKIHHGERGGVVLVRGTPSYVGLVHHMFGQIRHYGAGDVVVSSQLAAQLGKLAAVVPISMREPLAEEAALIPVSCEASGMISSDLVRVARSASWAEAAAADVTKPAMAGTRYT